MLNKVLLMGNLVRDAELRYLPSGSPLLEFRLAVSRRFRTREGEDRDETLFIDVTLFGRRAEAIQRYLSKGKRVFVEGRLKLDEWEKDGQRQSKIRVIADDIQFVGGNGGSGGEAGSEREEAEAYDQGGGRGSYGRGGGRAQGARNGGYARPGSAPAPAPAPVGGAAGGGLDDITEEDVPF
ncbi:MAG: hypothetical protein KatS3mg102_0926 [Planctomycetota bacterium]|nr:MAG: hypothetical protein KatS3mg102_0926 [Planctomycetota bacterium]